MTSILRERRADADVRAAETPVVYERQVGASLMGLTAVLVGAWGLICGYIGPYFGFRPLDYNAWTGSLQEGLLHAAPGGVAIAAGLMLMAMGPARRAVHHFGLMLPALALLAAGAWFVIGPVAWPAIEVGPAFTAASPLTNLLNVACASYAPGLVLVMLGGMALKASIVPRRAVEDPMTPVEAGRRPVVETNRRPVNSARTTDATTTTGRTVAEDEPTAARTGV